MRDRQVDGENAAEQLEADAQDGVEAGGGIETGEDLQPIAVAPQHGADDHADDAHLGEALAELEQRFHPEDALGAGHRRDALEFQPQRSRW